MQPQAMPLTPMHAAPPAMGINPLNTSMSQKNFVPVQGIDINQSRHGHNQSFDFNNTAPRKVGNQLPEPF